MDLSKSGYMVCHSCASFFKLDNDEPYVCPECKIVIDWTKYGSILNYVYDAVHFGYEYRLQYEDILEKDGDLKAGYFLSPPSDILVWIGLAALGGIVGGAAFETSKYVLNKIISSIKSHEDQDKIAEYYIIDDKENILKLTRYIGDYYFSLKSVPAEIKNTIIREMIVHEMENVVEEITDPELLKNHEYLLSKANPRVNEKLARKITEEEFNELWKNIELSG